MERMERQRGDHMDQRQGGHNVSLLFVFVCFFLVSLLRFNSVDSHSVWLRCRLVGFKPLMIAKERQFWNLIECTLEATLQTVIQCDCVVDSFGSTPLDDCKERAFFIMDDVTVLVYIYIYLVNFLCGRDSVETT